VKLPEMKLPRLSRESTPSTKGIQAPKVLRDLYADLRDRHLLPLVALLLVAIAAVPFLLGGKGGDDEKPVPANPAIATAPTDQAQFSVVPAARTLRAYGDRLGYRKPRDPFANGDSSLEESAGRTATKGSKAESGESAGEGGQAPEGGAPVEEGPTKTASAEFTTPSMTPPAESAVEAPAQPSVEAPVTTETPAETTHGGSNEGGGSDESGASPGSNDEPPTSVTYVATGIDAKAGFLGHVKAQEKIAPMTKLPNPKHPVVVYVGESNDKKGALFLMSSDVTAYYGKGRCALNGQVCQLLELKPGQSATFAYGYGKSRYKLQLRGLVGLTRTENQSSGHSSLPHKPAANDAVGPRKRG
jgi:hypothetical protein